MTCMERLDCAALLLPWQQQAAAAKWEAQACHNMQNSAREPSAWVLVFELAYRSDETVSFGLYQPASICCIQFSV